MSIIRRLFLIISLFTLVAGHAQAQTEAAAQGARQSSPTVVNAAVSAEGVRFSAPG